MNRSLPRYAFPILLATTLALYAQLPIPVPGQGAAPPNAPTAGRGGRGGRGPQAAAEPVKQVVTPIPTAAEVTGPGEFYETFMDDHDDETNTNILPRDVYARFNYEARE